MIFVPIYVLTLSTVYCDISFFGIFWQYYPHQVITLDYLINALCCFFVPKKILPFALLLDIVRLLFYLKNPAVW